MSAKPQLLDWILFVVEMNVYYSKVGDKPPQSTEMCLKWAISPDE